MAPDFRQWQSAQRQQELHAAGSSGPGFLALHPFIYLALLFSVFRSWLLVRKAAVPVGVRGGGLVCGVGPVGRTPHSFS